MPVPTTIDGLAELQRALERIPREVQALVAADALRAGAAVIQAGAQRRAPRKTGKLAGGMTTTITPIAGGLLAELSATTGANKIGRILDQFGTPVLAAARNARDLGVSAGEIETGMERAARGIGRAHGFLSAINPEF